MVLSGVPRKKSPLTPPGIDPGTVRLVAQRLILCSLCKLQSNDEKYKKASGMVRIILRTFASVLSASTSRDKDGEYHSDGPYERWSIT